MSVQLADAAVLVNNEVVPIVPNSLEFTEGFGEQAVLPQSIGEGNVENVFSNNLESSMAMVKFELRSTIENIKLARSWKQNQDQNVVQVAGRTVDGEMVRTFTGAVLVNDYPVPIGSDATIEIEFHSNRAV